MNNNSLKIVESYEKHLLCEGKKTKGFRYSFKVLNEYLDRGDFLCITYKDTQGFQSWMVRRPRRFTPATILSIIGPLSAFYDYLKKKRLVNVNPFRLLERIKVPLKLPKGIPDEAEIDELLTRLADFTRGTNLRDYKRDYKLHLLCELLYSSGMRISEAAAIRLEDLNLTGSSILVHDSKTKSIRTAYLNDYTKSILTIYLTEFREKVLWRGNSDLLFGTSNNLKSWLNGELERVCSGEEIDKVSTHIFRHCFGYHMLRAGCDIRKIQKFLGHKRLNTTGIYTKVDTEALRNVLDQYHPRSGQQREGR